MLAVSTFSRGLGVAPGLRIGDSGLPVPLRISDEGEALFGCDDAAEGPVTQIIMASPKGPVLQFEPGALHDRSWPKASYDCLRRGGLPGMVARDWLGIGRDERLRSQTYENQLTFLEL